MAGFLCDLLDNFSEDQMSRTYADWYKEIDALCWRHVGCSVNDLADFDTMAQYESGASPMEALRENEEVSELLDTDEDE